MNALSNFLRGLGLKISYSLGLTSSLTRVQRLLKDRRLCWLKSSEPYLEDRR